MTFQVFVTWQCRHSKRHWFSIFVLKNAQHDTRKKRHRPMIKFDECLLACRPTAPTPAMEEEPDLVMSSGTNRRPWTGFVMFLISRGTSESLRSNRFSLGPLYKFCVVGWGLLHDGTVECVALSLESLRSNRFFLGPFCKFFVVRWGLLHDGTVQCSVCGFIFTSGLLWRFQYYRYLMLQNLSSY